MKQGAFTFVLHTHLPYCRQAGRWPHGEEWVHEAASESYIPLLVALDALRVEGCRFKLTIGMTPILAEQLADDLVRDHMGEFLEGKVRRAEADVRRFRQDGDAHREAIARLYRDHYASVLDSYTQTYHTDILGGLARLQDDGYLEIATSAATHGYLPLFSRDSSIAGQVQVGVRAYRRHFGRAPRSFWLPECAYRPAYHATEDDRTYVRPGIESLLAEAGVRCFFCETHVLEGGAPVGKAVGEAVGPYGTIVRRYVAPPSPARPRTQATTFQAYWVAEPKVAVIGRNARTGIQVWSATHGYPGDFWYREFHKRDGVSGLQYWRVTDALKDLGTKDFYAPDRAAEQVRAHSAHFAGLVEEMVRGYHEGTGKFGIVCAAYDTELFGHWWFEGVEWLKQALRHLARSPSVELTTAGEFIAQRAPQDALTLPEGSWGQGGGHFTWQNADNSWMWPLIHEVEQRMERLAARFPDAQGHLREVLDQAAREKLLLESSDWPFLISTGQAREYAVLRFREHRERFQQLASAAEEDRAHEGAALARRLYERDKVFPDMDYRLFRSRKETGGYRA
ncbi:MAG: DUF1957 domain-containing protein [Chloroflexi bacterium]|nr:DUF1957 domain-containing protein [Chloroflexota bacterium]